MIFVELSSPIGLLTHHPIGLVRCNARRTALAAGSRNAAVSSQSVQSQEVDRAVIVDAWPMVRLGLSQVLQTMGIRAQAQVEEGAGAVAALRSQGGGLLIIGEHGAPQVELVRQVMRFEQRPRTIALLARPGPDELWELLAGGVDAVLPRSVGPEELTEAVRRVLVGDRVVSPGLLSVLFEGAARAGPAAPAMGRSDAGRSGPVTLRSAGPPIGAAAGGARGGAGVTVLAAPDRAATLQLLTVKEREVVRLLGTGRSNSDIADALFVSAATVKTHLAHIYAKLGVRSRRQAVALALSLGIVS